jgi:hypothetical protein
MTTSVNLDPIFVRPKVAARLLGIANTKLYELLKSGRLESRLVDRSRLISVASIRRIGEGESQ